MDREIRQESEAVSGPEPLEALRGDTAGFTRLSVDPRREDAGVKSELVSRLRTTLYTFFGQN